MIFLKMISVAFLIIGAVFFAAGTIGLLRFRDVHSRLHALSKADNLGLGFTSIGLMLNAESVSIAAKVVLVWLLALIASAITCFVIAEWEIEHGKRD